MTGIDKPDADTSARTELLHRLASAIPHPSAGEPVRVAVDGVDGAGKSMFADQLAAALNAAGRPVIRASTDSFHNPRGLRYRRGRHSPSGFWLDSYDYDRLRRDLLDPLSPGGSRIYRTAAHDVETDQPVDAPWTFASPAAVLVLDGLFLHRDELRDYWDFSIFLSVPFAETARRMAMRDGTNPDPNHPSMTRYVHGQRLYLAACDPSTKATITIDNTNWDNPAIIDQQQRTC